MVGHECLHRCTWTKSPLESIATTEEYDSQLTKLECFPFLEDLSASFARKNGLILVEVIRWGVHSEARPVDGPVFSCISNSLDSTSSAGVRSVDRTRS
jgi:hypothetical protein